MHPTIRKESEIKDSRVWCTLASQSSLLLSALSLAELLYGSWKSQLHRPWGFSVRWDEAIQWMLVLMNCLAWASLAMVRVKDSCLFVWKSRLIAIMEWIYAMSLGNIMRWGGQGDIWQQGYICPEARFHQSVTATLVLYWMFSMVLGLNVGGCMRKKPQRLIRGFNWCTYGPIIMAYQGHLMPTIQMLLDGTFNET